MPILLWSWLKNSGLDHTAWIFYLCVLSEHGVWPPSSLAVIGYLPQPVRHVNASHVPQWQKQLEDVSFWTESYLRGAELVGPIVGMDAWAGLICDQFANSNCTCMKRKLLWKEKNHRWSWYVCSFKTFIYFLINCILKLKADLWKSGEVQCHSQFGCNSQE